MPSSACHAKQDRTDHCDEPIELALLGPKVAVQLPASAPCVLEPEQNPGALGTKPNPSTGSHLWVWEGNGLWLHFLVSLALTFEGWNVWPKPSQHSLYVLFECHQCSHRQALIWLNYIYVFSRTPLLTPPLKTGFNLFPCGVWNPNTAALASEWQQENWHCQGKKSSLFSLSKQN